MYDGEELLIIELDQGDGWTRVRRQNDHEEGFVPTSYIECHVYNCWNFKWPILVHYFKIIAKTIFFIHYNIFGAMFLYLLSTNVYLKIVLTFKIGIYPKF